jgi:HAD superfamily hydrolase (TIGR01490 family)
MRAPESMDDPRLMRLAIFDLDHTLLAGDSDYEWGQYLVALGVVEREAYETANQRFYEQYKAGTLDIFEFTRFAFRPLAEHSLDELMRWRAEFMERRILPLVLPPARELIDRHRRAGHTLMIITATNRFVTEPIAAELGVPHLLATEPEMLDGRYTGALAGIPCFREGKVRRLEAWIEEHGGQDALQESWFYSDSHNDQPLLEWVDHPVAVDADVPLTELAGARGWPLISLRFPGAGDEAPVEG